MAYARGPWQLARASLARAPRACAGCRKRIGSSNRDRKLFYITPTPCPTRKIRHSVMRAVYRDSLFSTRRVFPETLSPHLGGGILPE